MRRFALIISLCAGFVCAASAFADAGTTSAGVTTTDPNAPSTNVQQQSSGFVAANQQLQNGAANGISLPATVAAAGSNGTQAGQGGAGNTGNNGAQAGQQPGGHGVAAEQMAPPPPPPTYESKMRPVNPTSVAPAAAPAQPAALAAPVQNPVSTPPKPAEPVVKPAVHPALKQDRVPPLSKTPEPAPSVTADPGGGRGAAPDGYTFWFGLLFAGAFLALAAVTYMRIQRGEAAN